MYRAVHFNALEEARLIQRFIVWKRFGCSLKEDSSILKHIKGKAGVVLYDNRTPVASGFFAAVEYMKTVHNFKAKALKSSGTIAAFKGPQTSKDTAVKRQGQKKTQPSVVERTEEAVDPFSISYPDDFNF